ncbi:MAG: ABC transporter substrate-binding protein [Ancalomicrobiaceae bacterium]|nr:ABC transporter substrate-binding protein [Ancalomicrobiaceae bacterium]
MKKLIIGLCAATALVAITAPAVAKDPIEVAVIVKATNSEFWQAVLVGARNYAKEHPADVTVTTNGPPAEADIAKQVSILEDTVSRGPKGIVISSTSSEATVPAIERAMSKGIPVVTIDNRVKTDKVASFLATDNAAGGKLAAKQLAEQLKAMGKPLKGKVALISSMAGVQVLIDRDSGFEAGLKEFAPDLVLLKPRYVNNDIFNAVNTAQDLVLSNPDLVGVFADNNTTGSGVAKVLTETGKKDSIVAIAFDSDPQEVEALRSGALKALVVQDPYGMGYKGVDSIVRALAGEKLPAYVDTGANVVTKANMDEANYKNLLDPLGRAIK